MADELRPHHRMLCSHVEGFWVLFGYSFHGLWVFRLFVHGDVIYRGSVGL